jgi:hypothetical protein
MIRSVTTLIYGIILAALVIATALLASIWILGMAAKAALFGEPRATLAVKLFERVMRERKTKSTDITVITSENENDK